MKIYPTKKWCERSAQIEGNSSVGAGSPALRVCPSYVIRLSPDGYYASNRPYTAVPRSEATVFPSMKRARGKLNRLQGRLMKAGNASIELNTLDKPS